MRYKEKPSNRPLTEDIKKDLKKITDIILKKGQEVEMVILFGSYARGEYKTKEDLGDMLDPKRGKLSDYDILVVTKSKKIATDTVFWQEIQEECNNQKLHAPARLMAHDIYDINDKLEIGQYFYKDIKQEGKILYNSGNFELAHEKPINKQRRLKIIKEYYQEWFERNSKTFFEQYKNAVKLGDYKNAAFQLHQATEAAYQVILFIFTNYVPHEHYLFILADMAAKKVDERLRSVFPKKSTKNYPIFEMLDYAYIGGRYDIYFKVNKEELEYIAPKVKELLNIVEEICLVEINSLTG